LLEKDLRDSLADILRDVPGIQDEAVRDELLDGVPRNVCFGLNRNRHNAQTDLDGIIAQLDPLGRLDNGTRPVVIVTSNALRRVRGTELGRKIEEIRSLIENAYGFDPPLADLPDVPEALIFGGDGEWVGNSFVEGAQTAARHVARLIVPRIFNGVRKPGVGLGTGWLVAPTLLLTNHHVVRSREPEEVVDILDTDFAAQGSKIEAWFDYHGEKETPPTTVSTEVLASSKRLDYALLRLKDAADMQTRGCMTIVPRDRMLSRGARLNIVQCPGGGPLRFAIRNNFFIGKGDHAFQVRYLTDTREGSSGSPVMNDQWQVVAIHRGARKVDPAAYQTAAFIVKATKYHNEGIAIHDILADLPIALRAEIGAG
jgi:hypothetical protein